MKNTFTKIAVFKPFLEVIKAANQTRKIKKRAARISTTASETLQWMDETYLFFENIKKKNK